MLIGYARVSTQDQNLDLQRDALEAAGCERVIVDRVSGATRERPGLDRLRDVLCAGDTLVVWRLDRLGRKGGRRPALDAEGRALAVRLYRERAHPIAAICRMMGISKPTLYGYVRAAEREAGGPGAEDGAR